jgi:hypothetical protein
MARFQWVILCERVIIEDQAKTISMVSLLENIVVPPPPPEMLRKGADSVQLPLRFFIVHQWERSNLKIGERVPARTRLITPTGKQFGEAETVVDLTVSLRSRVVGQALGIPVAGEGVYKCIIDAKIKNKWRKVGETEFGLMFQRAGRRH